MDEDTQHSVCDICGDLMWADTPHYCPPCDDPADAGLEDLRGLF